MDAISPLQPSADGDPEEDEGSGGVKPWDPAKIRITTKNFTLREICSQIAAGEIDLAPDFQRAFVWKDLQRTRLVESILLGIPLPAFYFSQDADGAYQVVDGVQRLSTISLFMDDRHALDERDLEYLKIGGQKYSTLDTGLRRRFAGTQIVVHVIEPQTPDELKYDIFSRVNTLGSPLSAQEIRHAMSKPRARGFLQRLADLPSFELATDKFFGSGQTRDNHRMMDRELALRFCAFQVTPLEEYRQFEKLDSFLLDFMKRVDGKPARIGPALSDGQLTDLSVSFDFAMQSAALILGKNAFRRTARSRGPINRALFESQALALAPHPHHVLAGRKTEVGQALANLLDQPEYLKSVTVSTGGTQQVQQRLEQARSAVAKALE